MSTELPVNVNKISSEIVEAFSYHDTNKLKNIKHDLQMERMKVDKFMSKFLKMFERKMNWEGDTKTPICELYRKKTSEYCKISNLIRQVDHILSKN